MQEQALGLSVHGQDALLQGPCLLFPPPRLRVPHEQQRSLFSPPTKLVSPGVLLPAPYHPEDVLKILKQGLNSPKPGPSRRMLAGHFLETSRVSGHEPPTCRSPHTSLRATAQEAGLLGWDQVRGWARSAA